MPAYSFKEQFVPMVLNGSKPHTLRNYRKNRAKVGDKLYLYFGMRTKWCKKLREEICTATYGVSISERYGVVFYERLLTPLEIQMITLKVYSPISPILPGYFIADKESFAWRDGFRPKRTDSLQSSFDLMRKCWLKMHSLPWAGDYIEWKPLPLKKVSKSKKNK